MREGWMYCGMCKSQVNLVIVRNPWGDIGMCCKECVPKWDKMWKGDEE